MVRQGNQFDIQQDIQRVQNGKLIIELEILNGKIFHVQLLEERDGKIQKVG